MDEIIDALIELLESGEEVPDAVLDEIVDFLEGEIQGEVEEEPIEPTIPSGAGELWILSGENPRVFIEYLQTFPDPALNALARNPTQLQQVISRLSEQITAPAGEVADGVAKAPLQSSNVYGFQYNPRDKQLKVRFNSGSVYKYQGVPPQIFKMFQGGAVPAKTNGRNQYGRWWEGKMPSLGAAFYQLIRQGGFPYARLK